MTEKVLKYRQKHKRCKYCKYLRIHSYRCSGSDYYCCEAKDKTINYLLPDMTTVPRWFCQCYEVKESGE